MYIIPEFLSFPLPGDLVPLRTGLVGNGGILVGGIGCIGTRYQEVNLNNIPKEPMLRSEPGCGRSAASLKHRILFETRNLMVINKPPDVRMDGPAPVTVEKLLLRLLSESRADAPPKLKPLHRH